MATKYYAVKKGKKNGIYYTWDACKEQVTGYSGAIYKSFQTLEEAKSYLGTNVAGCVKQDKIKQTEPSEFYTIPQILEKKDSRIAVAYVDGSYYHATKEFSYGAVIAYKGEKYEFCEKFSQEDLASMRNVAGEIKGAECAMQFALDHGCEEIYIYHDYEGIARWCLGEWKTNKEGTKNYKQFYECAKAQVNIHFMKVKGHSGDPYNDLADALAKKALGII